MTDQTHLTYAAQLTLTVPGNGPSATVTVTLAPGDTVLSSGQAKPLSECTLAELRAYAGALEAEVWETYGAITLHQLVEESQLEVEVKALDESGGTGAPVADWVQQAIILAPTAAAPATAEELPGTAAHETAPESLPASDPPPAPETQERQAATAPAEPETPAAPEPSGPAAGAVNTPAIIPSQARVRVAGGRLPLAESGGAAVDILLDEAPLRAMQAHALSSLDREVAGVMVGRQPEKQPDGRYVVHVIDSIIAKHTKMQGASVTYTPESWRYLNDTLWERYPNESAVMVGWYHTHPGFGIFLSGMDLFIHQNFFTQIWHVAYVLDPRARTSGFFCWNRQKTKVNRYDFLWPDWAAESW